MEKLNNRLEKYHLYRVRARSNIGYELADEYRDEIIKDFKLTSEKFQEIYIKYVKDKTK